MAQPQGGCQKRRGAAAVTQTTPTSTPPGSYSASEESATPIDRVLARLREVSRSGKGWKACCPAHDDRHPSLSVREASDGRLHLNCFVGCTRQEICDALGITVDDLQPGEVAQVEDNRDHHDHDGPEERYLTAERAIAELERTHGPASAKWEYQNAAGDAAGIVLRFDLADGGKRIRPVSHLGGMWRIAGMSPPRPLYRLPELGGAERVYIVEGEKCAEATRSLGLVVTTSVHGAKSAAKTNWAPLAGKDVVILPDNDDAGKKYAQDVAAIVTGLTPAASVRIVDLPGLPEAGDIVDWIAAQGETADRAELRRQIEALVQAAPAWTPVATVANGPSRVNESSSLAVDPWPDPPAPEAFHGIAGELVDLLDPHTEADRAAILIQFLAGFGNLIGSGPHFRVEGDYHAAKLNVVLVGATSKGRKGTSAGQVLRILGRVDETWGTDRVLKGLSSGEGLIWAVRDPILKHEAIKDKGHVVEYQDVEVDPGVEDKRAFVLESEFVSVLKVMQREKNTLSAVIRDAWDRDTLRTLTKNTPAKSTGCHITIVGHITRDELRRTVAETEMANGFANRFLWMCVKRSKCIPQGTALSDSALEPYVTRLAAAADAARKVERVGLDAEAAKLWAEVYPALSEGKPGLLGAVTSRAEAQVTRLALVYALLDHAVAIRPCHLTAALAVWDYAEASVRYIFGSRLGDPLADKILAELKSCPEGLSRTDLSGRLGRNRTADEINRALSTLAESGLARVQNNPGTAGRPAQVWFSL